MKVHLADGEELGCVVDSGSPLTLLMSVLAPRLGTRLETGKWFGTSRGLETNGLYLAPPLYLGSTRLLADAAQSNRQDEDTATYHYTVVRESEGSRWKLQRAWQTDADERVAEEYPVP